MKYTDIDFNGKHILITGGAGFIGSNLAFYFQKNYPDSHIVVLDRFCDGSTFSNGNLQSFGHFKNLIGFKGEVIAGDINDFSTLETVKKLKIDYIFHQAAISDTTVLDQEIMMKTNVNAFVDLLDIAKEKGANVIYASSAATYGNQGDIQRVGEESPENIYGFSKLMMDNIARKYMQKSDISIVGLRYFNVYGEREFYKNTTASMVVQLGHQILKGNAPKLFENSDKILRDFIYIGDVIQANILGMHPKKSGVYNIGTGKPRSFQDIADILQKELGTDYGTQYIKNPYKAYQTYTQADIKDTQKNLGYEPKFSLENGIKAYIPEIKRLYEKEVLNG